MHARAGGGLGGRKESGQLRFGGRDRPFRAPLMLHAGVETDVGERNLSVYQRGRCYDSPPRRTNEAHDMEREKDKDRAREKRTHDDAPSIARRRTREA